MNKKNLRQEKGITLIALVITIIVMLILVAVTINIAVNGGLFGYAGNAVSQTKTARDEEQNYANVESGLTTDQLIAKYTDTSVTNPYTSDNPTKTWACSTSSGAWSEATGSETSGILAKLYAKGTEGTEYHLVIEPAGETGSMGSLYAFNKQNENYRVASTGFVSIYGDAFRVAIASSKSYKAWEADSSYKDNITKVIICDGVINIGERAFKNCSSLTSVTISSDVSSIGDNAFHGCTSLTSITFKGTKAQWESVSRGENWKGSIKTINCSDGETETELTGVEQPDAKPLK